MTPLRPTRTRRLLPLGAALAAGLALAACSSPAANSADDASGAASDQPLKVVATTTQLTDFAGEVGGDDLDLTGLLAPGGSAHHFDPSPADLLALGEADVLIVNGAGLETFIDSAVEASGFSGEIVDASQGIDLHEAEEITAEAEAAGGHEHEDHEHEAEAHDHEAEDHEHEHEDHDHEHADEADEAAHDDHDHDHGPVNPHLWTAPRYAAGMVQQIATGLAAADPDRAADYEQRAEAYEQRLDELDAWIAEQFERVPEADRVLVSGHDSLRYYLHDYGIEFAGSILPSFEDNAEPSAADIDALVQAIEDRGVKAVFVESSMSPKLAETIAKEAGVQIVDSAALYTDSLGAPDSGADDYVSATVHNTRTILEAWGVEPDEPPASLG